MDCYRSFTFSAGGITTLTGAEIKQWSTGAAQHFWQANFGTSSTYNIQGFKNIDVYGVDVLGSIQTIASGTSGAIVNDWKIDVQVGGQAPLLGGFITASPNYYSIDGSSPNNLIYPLGKYTNSIRFGNPIISTKFIQLQTTIAQGIGWETAGTIVLRSMLNFIVYYKFEDE